MVANLLAELEPEEAEAEDPKSEREPELDGEAEQLPQEFVGGKADYAAHGGYGNQCAEDVPPDDRKLPKTLRRIRPPGTLGLPTPWVRPLKNDVPLKCPENSDLPQLYAAALSALIAEIKRTGAGQKRYELENGIQVEVAGDTLIYEFAFTDDADLFQDTKVEVQIFGKRIAASILSIEAGRLTLSTSEDLGPTVARVVLLVDATALLEVLKDRIEQVGKGEVKLNRAIADAVVGKAQIPDAPPTLVPAPPKKN